MSGPVVAIAHDYLTQRGGAERVALAMAKGFPGAAIYTTLYEPEQTFDEFRDIEVRPSFINRFGPLRRDHRKALPLLPLASSAIEVEADIVIASSSGWAHGFGGNHKTLVYCYSPARWLYQSDVYLSKEAGFTTRAGLAALSPILKRWDRTQASRADRYLAISTVVRQRIAETYGRQSEVLPAPISDRLRSVPADPVQHHFIEQGGYFLCVSRLLPYKNVDEVVGAFALLPQERLVVLGRGPERDRLAAKATPNVVFMQDLTDGQVRTLYERSCGLIAASHEDYGLTPLEAALFGKPSAVLRAGGFLDTMIEGQTAVFFPEPRSVHIAEAVRRLATENWSADSLVGHASRFTEDAFIAALRAHIDEMWATDGE